jgi:hypothetical protein
MSETRYDNAQSSDPSNSEDGGRQARSAGGASGGSGPAGYSSEDSVGAFPSLGPTDEEVVAWAEREHARRQAWLAGPSDEEKHEWRRQERQRRLVRLGYAGAFDPEREPSHGSPRDSRRLSKRYARDAQLATEGLGLLLATLPFRMLAELVSAGREWEEDYPEGLRRRVPLYDDDYE